MDAIDAERIAELKQSYPDSAFISAERGIGLGKLGARIQELIEEDFVTKTMTIPVSKYEGVAFLHREAKVIEKKYIGSDIKLTFDIAKADLKRLKKLINNIDTGHTVT
jgi:GTP-binding protein HflX